MNMCVSMLGLFRFDGRGLWSLLDSRTYPHQRASMAMSAAFWVTSRPWLARTERSKGALGKAGGESGIRT
jgi:hypothetical protein